MFYILRDEIGLIPCPEARYNRSPIVLVENKLGVESWCVKFLLPYVHNKLLLYRTRKQWLNKDGEYELCPPPLFFRNRMEYRGRKLLWVLAFLDLGSGSFIRCLGGSITSLSDEEFEPVSTFSFCLHSDTGFQATYCSLDSTSEQF